MDQLGAGRSAEGTSAVVRVPSGPWPRREVLRLDSELAELAEEDSHRVVILEASGPDFCPGVEDALYGGPLGVDPAARLAGQSRPTVAAISGACTAAGLSLVLAADLRVAAPDASFRLPEIPEGRFPLWGAIQRLTRVVGPAAAASMVLLGHPLDAPEALRLGLVHEVRDRPSERAREMADLLAARGPLALEYAKEAIWRGRELPMHHALRLEADFNHLLQASADRAEGLAAFFEKRDPRFEDR